MQSQSLFERGNAVVRDLDHVKVERILAAGTNGQPITLYRKIFKHKGWDIWSDRENRFLTFFHSASLRHVVQMHKLEAATPGAVSSVDTHDAGLTIEEWMQVAPKYADGTHFNHPFRRGDECVRLLRACLVALKEIHANGIVHCDIKQDNICLPFLPRSYHAGSTLKPDFDEIRLIDFSFSLGRNQPLEQPLPILPKEDYQAPQLKAALAADLRSGKPIETIKLDYRVDLFGLGYMGQQILASEECYWETEERGASGKVLLRDVIDTLLSMGDKRSVLSFFNTGRPHDQLIRKLDDWLRHSPPQEAFVPKIRTMEGAPPEVPLGAIPTTPITPIATPTHACADQSASNTVTRIKISISSWEPTHLITPALLTLVVALAGGAYWWISHRLDPPPPVEVIKVKTKPKPSPLERPVPQPETLVMRAAALADALSAAGQGKADYRSLLKRYAQNDADEADLASKTLETLKRRWLSTDQDAVAASRREAALPPLLWLLTLRTAPEQARLRAELGSRYWQDSEAGPMKANWWLDNGPRQADKFGQAWLRQTEQLAQAGVFSAMVVLARAQYSGKGRTVDQAGAGTMLSKALQTLDKSSLSAKRTSDPLRDALALSTLGLAQGKNFATTIRPGLEHLAGFGHVYARFLLGGLMVCRANEIDAGRKIFIDLKKDSKAAGEVEYANRAQNAIDLLKPKEHTKLCDWMREWRISTNSKKRIAQEPRP